MKNLVNKLNEAAKVYYSEGNSIMSDKEYDTLYAQLEKMEQETGIILSDSPTQRVGFEVVSDLPKVEHKYPMLSLQKTKDYENIEKWLDEKEGVLSWKMDGLTIVATYQDGVLQQIITRGNGYIGENVTHNAPFISGLPKTIPYKKDLVVRGEVIISYDDFNKINEEVVATGEEPYKNPRNLASSSVRLLDTKRTSKRCLQFYAFTIADPYEKESPDIPNNVIDAFLWLSKMGFSVVEHKYVTKDSLKECMDFFSAKVSSIEFPVDGLVLTYNLFDRTLGSTGKYPKHSMAFKWSDETKETILKAIEWSASKTGLLNPVAIFEPVELEGTTVQRASLHNVSTIQDLNLHLADMITVYKSNMIIPCIDENLGGGEKEPIKIPVKCPVCGQSTEKRNGKKEDVVFLFCTNPSCPAKHVGVFERLVHRDALNVEGISKATLQEFLNHGFLKEPADLFHLDKLKDTIISLDGFGEKSYQNMIQAIEKAKSTTFQRFFYSLGIPGAGKHVAKIINNYFEETLDSETSKVDRLMKMLAADKPEFSDLDGIGEVNEKSMVEWFDVHQLEMYRLYEELNITDEYVNPVSEKKNDLDGLTFVITGSVEHYKNRNELKAEIESRGGKVSGSVSKKTSYLINNDVTSTSGKNKKAKELGVPIISEEQYMKF